MLSGLHRLSELDRRVNDAKDGLETWVRMYRIDTTGCDWVGVG